jgi:hypothetical protein
MKKMERFKKFDVEGSIEQEIRRELKANWKDYLEDYPDDWGFLLKIWPDFDKLIKISGYESMVGLMSTLNNLNEEALHMFIKSTTVNIGSSVRRICLDRNPNLYFSFQAKLQGSLDWVAELLNELPPDTEKAIM